MVMSFIVLLDGSFIGWECPLAKICVCDRGSKCKKSFRKAGQGGGANGGVAQLDDVGQLSHGNHEAHFVSLRSSSSSKSIENLLAHDLYV